LSPDGVIEVLGLHANPNDIAAIQTLLSGVSQFRQFWCMSMSLVYTATGAIDVFCSPRRARIFDLAAGLLLIREVGGVVTDLAGDPIDLVPIDLTTRTTLLCSAHRDLHREALRLQAAPFSEKS
jgi:fructose-1,6-bisphosphatase/inositol monophosphatase family enzyme